MYMHKYSLVHSVSDGGSDDNDSDDGLQIDSSHWTELDSSIKRVGTSSPTVPLQ